MHEMLNAARKELARLQDRVSALPEYRKLVVINKLIEVYEKFEGVPDEAPAPAPIRPYRHSGSKSAMIERIAELHLRKTGRRATTGAFVSAVLEAGVDLGAGRPTSLVSSVLTTSPLFDNRRELGGYGLAEWSRDA